MKRLAIRIFGILVVLLVFVLSACYLFRDHIFHAVLEKAQHKIESRFGARLSVRVARMTGWNDFYLTGIQLLPAGHNQPLLEIDSVSASMDLKAALFNDIRLTELYLSGLKLTAIRRNGRDNFSTFLKRRKEASSTGNASPMSFAEKTDRLMELVFEHVPGDAVLSSARMSFADEEKYVSFSISDLYIRRSSFKGSAFTEEHGRRSVWRLSGTLDRNNFSVSMSLWADSGEVSIPYIGDRWNMSCRFDTLACAVGREYFEEDKLGLRGDLSFSGLTLNHRRIALNDIWFRELRLSFKAEIGKNYVRLDSSAATTINRISARPYLYVAKQDTSYQVNLMVKAEQIPALEFFMSLPEGAFATTRDIVAEGRLNYRMDFTMNTGLPDSLKFSSSMTGDSFKIKKYGPAALTRINGPFAHTAYEKDVPVKTFVVGPGNPGFVPLDQISVHLKNAVRTSEDGSFFYHRGFNEEAFQKSIIQNFKEKRFVRGGSTITMQLVKNVFLSRNKTVVRKMEEALIVWLIENNRLCSKERMFEVYLNIIEWGPGIYGIAEASEFYFKKKPSELTLTESIFLASIVPRPKWFKYSFDEQGNLKGYLQDYYKLVSGFLLKHQLITEEEHSRVTSDFKLELKGPARRMVLPADSIPSDSLLLQMQEGEE